MYDLIIIGSGPAGLSAAVYAKRAGLDALVMEKSPMSGGQVLTTYEVDNYLGMPGINGYDLGMKFREHADRMGVEFLETEVSGVERIKNRNRYEENTSELVAASNSGAGEGFCIVTDKGEYRAKTILAATGAVHAKLGVPGEEELAGMGVSYCATCDGAFFRNRVVAVVGGGDVAVEDAIFLARTSQKVYLIHRRDELRAAKVLQERVKNLSNVEILWDTVVDEILGEDQVKKISIRNVVSGEKRELEMDGVFIAVGIHPNTELFENLVECDEKGYIIAGEDGATTEDGIFAAGDVRSKPLRQIVTAVADGANAIAGIQNFL
ncbi:MAG: thioredoxin-disulfide reductase [Lachnospiraceae bacterium]|jgi:thioredoxin reductase (NADPH)|nr:thioredoxin-disulfide reductase [Lachnospiraceae bacterium]MCI9109072.1 thioredoxin-disulfide reductase [Lachnospiraceae bacterium]MCI9343109.1 thioredoxin-disulfide reductase [Lachnospiraceae bacterium]GFH90400.1 thioredoxin reductase [Lachnospiraceae bacterium]